MSLNNFANRRRMSVLTSIILVYVIYKRFSFALNFISLKTVQFQTLGNFLNLFTNNLCCYCTLLVIV